MKFTLLAAVAALAISSISAPAAEGASPESETKAVMEKIQAKLNEGKSTEADLGPEIKEFDALAAKYSSDPDTVSQVLFMKGMLYLEVLQEPTKALTIFNEIKAKYPKTEVGSNIDELIASVKHLDEMKKINAALTPGTQFPPFEVTDVDGKPLSIASRKAKVILIDFWATWCVPCLYALPGVIATYDKYHDKGFDVIGINLDDERTPFVNFLKKYKVQWPQYFDGLAWKNKLAVQYGVTAIPATFLVDGEGKILARDLHGEELEKAVSKALGGN